MKKKIIGVVFLFFMIFSLNMIVYAEYGDVRVVQQGQVGAYPNVTRTSGCGKAEFQGCYPNLEAAYRFTLVDKNGKKIDGTTSVDYTGFEDTFNKWASHTYLPINAHARYKYGVNENEIKFIYLAANSSVDNYSFGGPTPYNINTFIDNLSDYVQNIEESTPKWRNSDGVPVNFLDLFLYDSGYITDIDRPHLTDYRGGALFDRFTNEDDPVYLIIEPTYFVWYNKVANVWTYTNNYGTINEYAQAMYNNPENGLSWGLSEHMAFNHACHLSTPVTTDGLKVIKENVTNNCQYSKTYSVKNSEGKDIYLTWYQQNVEKLANNDYGYGVFALNITSNFKDDNKKCDKDYCVNYCESGDGVVSFKPSSMISNEKLKNSKELSDNPSIDDARYRVSCYDSVNYDFRDSLDGLNGTKRILTYLNLNPGKSEIYRKCWVGQLATTPTFDSVVGDYVTYNSVTDTYDSKFVNIEAFKKSTGDKKGTYYLEAKVIEDSKNGPSVEATYGDGKIVTYSFTLSYNLKDSDKILLMSKPERLESGMYINFLDTPFGASNKIIDNMPNKVSYSDATFDGEGKVENAKCYFDIEYISGEVKFRTISLDNPFPARDGTARLPGINWLYKDNFVYDYITNNRGVKFQYAMNHDMMDHSGINVGKYDAELLENLSAEALYTELQPMYTVTLTPSTMMAIRKYNKTHQYTSMYLDETQDSSAHKFTYKNGETVVDHCVDGRQCYSTFLRDENLIPADAISGTCYRDSDGDLLTENSLHLYVMSSTVYWLGGEDRFQLHVSENKYDPDFDPNRNLKYDNVDRSITRQKNETKTTKFYMCAGKTYYSGGPIEESVVVEGDDE